MLPRSPLPLALPLATAPRTKRRRRMRLTTTRHRTPLVNPFVLLFTLSILSSYFPPRCTGFLLHVMAMACVLTDSFFCSSSCSLRRCATRGICYVTLDGIVFACLRSRVTSTSKPTLELGMDTDTEASSAPTSPMMPQVTPVELPSSQRKNRFLSSSSPSGQSPSDTAATSPIILDTRTSTTVSPPTHSPSRHHQHSDSR